MKSGSWDKPADIPKPWSARASLTPRRTYSSDSKIVYKRKKHLWTEKDIARISKAIEKEQKENFGWVETIINYLADLMLDKILGVLGLDESYAKLAWRTIMNLWMKLVRKMFPEDTRIESVSQQYEEAMRLAIKEKLEGLPEWESNFVQRVAKAIGY